MEAFRLLSNQAKHRQLISTQTKLANVSSEDIDRLIKFGSYLVLQWIQPVNSK